jgi:hypothetical protein
MAVLARVLLSLGSHRTHSLRDFCTIIRVSITPNSRRIRPRKMVQEPIHLPLHSALVYLASAGKYTDLQTPAKQHLFALTRSLRAVLLNRKSPQDIKLCHRAMIPLQQHLLATRLLDPLHKIILSRSQRRISNLAHSPTTSSLLYQKLLCHHPRTACQKNTPTTMLQSSLPPVNCRIMWSDRYLPSASWLNVAGVCPPRSHNLCSTLRCVECRGLHHH